MFSPLLCPCSVLGVWRRAQRREGGAGCGDAGGDDSWRQPWPQPYPGGHAATQEHGGVWAAALWTAGVWLSQKPNPKNPRSNVIQSLSLSFLKETTTIIKMILRLMIVFIGCLTMLWVTIDVFFVCTRHKTLHSFLSNETLHYWKTPLKMWYRFCIKMSKNDPTFVMYILLNFLFILSEIFPTMIKPREIPNFI